jgi:hypothetical protein
MAASSFAVRERSTKVTMLKGLTIICESKSCEIPARFLFCTAAGPISAYCHFHTREIALRMGLRLPEGLEQNAVRSRLAVSWTL